MNGFRIIDNRTIVQEYADGGLGSRVEIMDFDPITLTEQESEFLRPLELKNWPCIAIPILAPDPKYLPLASNDGQFPLPDKAEL